MKKLILIIFLIPVINLIGQNCADQNALSLVDASVSCHYDVNCPLGADWDHYKDELKKSVVRISNGGTGLANYVGSGVLVNNTSQNKALYILTAFHVVEPDLPSSGPAVGYKFDDYVFTFGWISPEATTFCGTEGNNDPGPLDMVLCGAELLAWGEDSDYALLAVDGEVEADWDIVWAGWDKSDTDPTFEVGIHHPRGDVMKVSRDDTGAFKSTLLSGLKVWSISSINGSAGWEIGMVESGSSGSPLFDQKGHVIGQLAGGGSNGQCDQSSIFRRGLYGRLAVSWDDGLSQWLDPLTLGVDVFESCPPIVPPAPTNLGCSITRDGQQIFWSDIPGATSYTLTIQLNGCCNGIGTPNPPAPVSYSVNSNTVSISSLNLGFFNCFSWSVTAEYSNGLDSPASITQCFDPEGPCVGLEFRQQAASTADPIINIFPNPSNGIVNVAVESTLDEFYQLDIYNSNGTLMQSIDDQLIKTIEARTREQDQTIHLEPGLYFFVISTSDKQIVRKVLVQ